MPRCSLLSLSYLRPLAPSLASLSPSRSLAKHPQCMLKLQFTPSRVAAIAAPRVLGGGGNPEFLPLHFWFPRLPLCSLWLNPLPSLLVFSRRQLIRSFPPFRPKQPPVVSSSGETSFSRFLALTASVGGVEPFVITRFLSGRSGRRLRVFVSSTVAAPSSPELLEPSLFLRVPQVAPP